MQELEECSVEGGGEAPLTREETEQELLSKAESTNSGAGRCTEVCPSLCGLFTAIAQRFNCRKHRRRRKRRVKISRTPHNGLFVRMLGEAKGSEEAASSSGLKPNEEASSRRPSKGLWEEGERGSIFLSRVASFSGGQQDEAEERLLSRAAGRHPFSSSRQRFLTLHRRRRRRPPTRGLHSNAALLDDLYHGPTQCLLNRVGDWDFNAFALDSVCGGRPVTVLCAFLTHKYGLLQTFKFDTVSVWKCFSLIEEGYHASNPYHNAIHAADVTQAMHCYLQENAIERTLTPMETFAALVAAVCHDLDHPGVNQPFLIATDNHLAALYNNASVLENHHWRCAMGCLWESGLLDTWTPDEVSEFQEMIRSLILATDITRQNEFLSRFKDYQETRTLDMSIAENRHFSLQIALKCADICNPCRPWEVSRQWSIKICDEFYRQGDYERQLHLPVTPMCDRYVNSVAKIQTGFIKFVVGPLFDAWDSWLKTFLSNSMISNLQNNLVKWENCLSEETEMEVCTAPTATKVVFEKLADSKEASPLPFCRTSKIEVPSCVLGSIETLHIGRRHSLPINSPSLLPRTVIRRESLSGDGQPTLIYETVVMGDMSAASVTTSTLKEREGDVSPGSLYPDPSIATMGDVGRSKRSDPPARVPRRKSLPPLWGSSFSHGRVLTLEPLPQTPLLEDVSTEVEKKEKKKSSEGSLKEQTGGGSLHMEDPASHSEGRGKPDAPDESSQKLETKMCSLQRELGKRDAIGKSKDKPVSAGRRFSLSHYSVAQRDVLDAPLRRSVLKEHGFARRASLDGNCSASKRELIRLQKEIPSGKRLGRFETTIDPTPFYRNDKENRAPASRVSPGLWKTRLWKSLTQEEDILNESRDLPCTMYKSVNQGKGYGRRGSAPLLRLDELRGGLRGGADYFSRRRCSAPSNQLQTGTDSMRLLSDGMHRPLFLRERTALEENSVLLTSKILTRRCSGASTGERHQLAEISNFGKEDFGSSAGTEFPSVLPTNGGSGGSGPSAFSSFGVLGIPSHEARRGSGSFELLSGLWRNQLDQNYYTSCLDEFGNLPLSGGGTPATPSSAGSSGVYQVMPPFLPPIFNRRGSLPTDALRTGDIRLWSAEES